MITKSASVSGFRFTEVWTQMQDFQRKKVKTGRDGLGGFFKNNTDTAEAGQAKTIGSCYKNRTK